LQNAHLCPPWIAFTEYLVDLMADGLQGLLHEEVVDHI
jgi:hypothetical protein